jgi:hypothetical protein
MELLLNGIVGVEINWSIYSYINTYAIYATVEDPKEAERRCRKELKYMKASVLPKL